MNKKSISLAFVSLFCATAMLAGCSKSDAEEKEVASMKLSGIPTAYQVGDTINWAAAKVAVSYKDSQDKDTYTGSQLEYDVTSEVAATTKVVVYTDGLHAQTTLTEGEYNIEAALAGKLTEKYSLGRIVVGKITDDKYTLDSFEAPEFVDTYKQKIADSQAHPENESSFKSTSELFTVGTKNVFKFVPRASFEMKGSTEHAKRYTNYEKNFFLKEIKSDSSKVDALTSDYEIVADQSGIQFKDSAVGKKFEVTVSPKDSGFAEDSNGHPAVVSFQFQVKDGLNVYNAKQLGALNLTATRGLQYNADPAHRYVSHFGKADGQQQANHSKHYFTEGNENGVSSVFWDKVSQSYAKIDCSGLWKDFLTYDEQNNPEGIFTPEEIVKYSDIKGVFFQNEIVLNKEDIPADYFITADETGNRDGYADMECLRDAAEIYTPMVGIAENGNDRSQDIEINGNYFMLDNRLPLCKSNSGDAATSGFHTYGPNTSSVMGTYDPGHASLFKFCGIGVERSNNWAYKNKDVHKGAKGILKNLNTKGVIEDVSGDNVLSVTAMIAAKNCYCSAEYSNNIIKSYQIGIFPDNMIKGEFLTISMGSETYKYNTIIENCRIYDCSNCAICNYHNGGAVVKTSDFARFGGAAILNAGDIEEMTDTNYWPYAMQIRDQEIDDTGSSSIDPYAATSDYEDAWRSFVYVDEASSQSFNNYVVGTEAYFTAVGIATMMPEVFQYILPGYNTMFNTIGHAFRFEQGGKNVYNIISLNLDGHNYVMSPNRYWYGDVVMYADNDEKRLDSGVKMAGADTAFAKYQTLDTILTSNGQSCPAVFYTEYGDVFTSLWNPSTRPTPVATQGDVFYTIDSVIAFLMTGMTDPTKLVPFAFTPANESSTISVLLPANTTTINAVFELKANA